MQAAMRRVTEVPVKAGDAVVRQGEPADRFYVIVDGQFDVVQAGRAGGPERHLRTLGPDQVFGELGLLRQAPRSASVVAKEDGKVLAMEAKDFLALVGAEGSLRGRLMGLYGSGRAGARA
jgi:CRP-like cAMP-binding protein